MLEKQLQQIPYKTRLYVYVLWSYTYVYSKLYTYCTVRPTLLPYTYVECTRTVECTVLLTSNSRFPLNSLRFAIYSIPMYYYIIPKILTYLQIYTQSVYLHMYTAYISLYWWPWESGAAFLTYMSSLPPPNTHRHFSIHGNVCFKNKEHEIKLIAPCSVAFSVIFRLRRIFNIGIYCIQYFNFKRIQNQNVLLMCMLQYVK